MSFDAVAAVLIIPALAAARAGACCPGIGSLRGSM